MKTPLLLCIGFTMLVSTMGCATRMNEIMQSWEGHHYSNLIASWGPPQQILDDGSGRENSRLGRYLILYGTRAGDHVDVRQRHRIWGHGKRLSHRLYHIHASPNIQLARLSYVLGK